MTDAAPSVMLAELDRAILAAHADRDGVRLARLYGEAAARLEAGGDIQAACFFRTQAYIFALEQGAPEAAAHAAALKRHGRL